jgi:alpha-maltose-1-phosphate synthase
VSKRRTPIVVTHPGRQHSFETAYAAQEAGLLYRYITSFYHTGRPLLPNLGRVVPRRLKGKLEFEVRRRWHPDLDPQRVITYPGPHLGFQLAQRLLPLGQRIVTELAETANGAFEDRVCGWLRESEGTELVHAFEGGALRTFNTIRRLGYVGILDVTSKHEECVQLDISERRQWGLRPKYHSPRSTRRIRAERKVADVLLVPSESAAETVSKDGVSTDRIVLVPYGAGPSFLHSRWCGGQGVFRVVCAGRITARKGIGYLLQAWSNAALKGAELVLVGFPDDDGQALLSRLPGSCRVTGALPYSKMAEILGSCDLFVCPSLTETGPLVVYEAMATGLPVITTENARAAVRDGVDGIVVPIRDSDALQEAILFMYRNPETRARMGAAARERIQAGFTWGHYRRRLAYIYQKLLTTGTAVSPPLPQG